MVPYLLYKHQIQLLTKVSILVFVFLKVGVTDVIIVISVFILLQKAECLHSLSRHMWYKSQMLGKLKLSKYMSSKFYNVFYASGSLPAPFCLFNCLPIKLCLQRFPEKGKKSEGRRNHSVLSLLLLPFSFTPIKAKIFFQMNF